MSVRITGIAEAKAQLREIEAFLNSPKPMQGIVDDIKDGIQEKTAAGHDYRGRNFKGYSTAYKKKRTGMGLSTKPDLTVTGTMMNSLKAEVINPRHGRVSVPPVSAGKINADMLAAIHNEGIGKQEKREFINITESGIKKIAKKHYDDPILEIVRKYR